MAFDFLWSQPWFWSHVLLRALTVALLTVVNVVPVGTVVTLVTVVTAVTVLTVVTVSFFSTHAPWHVKENAPF